DQLIEQLIIKVNSQLIDIIVDKDIGIVTNQVFDQVKYYKKDEFFFHSK
ncbi:22669_t:CDS:1, partial [Dentiscutata erythropus]